MNRDPSEKAYQMEALFALYQVISHIESIKSDYSIEEVKKVLRKTTTFAECVFLVYNNYKIEEKDTQTVILRKLVQVLRFVSSHELHLSFHIAFTVSLLRTVKIGVGTSHAKFDTLSYISAVANALGEIISIEKVISKVIENETVFLTLASLVQTLETQPAYHLQLQLINIASRLVKLAWESSDEKKDFILNNMTTTVINEDVICKAAVANENVKVRQLHDFILSTITNKEERSVSFEPESVASTRSHDFVSGINILSTKITGVKVNDKVFNANWPLNVYLTVIGVCIITEPTIESDEEKVRDENNEITIGWDSIIAIYCSKDHIRFKVKTLHSLLTDKVKELLNCREDEQSNVNFEVQVLLLKDALQTTLKTLIYKPREIKLFALGGMEIKSVNKNYYLDNLDPYKVKEAFTKKKSEWELIIQSEEEISEWSCYFAEEARLLMGDKSTESYVHELYTTAESKDVQDAVSRTFASALAIKTHQQPN
jgi:hypothetical protein